MKPLVEGERPVADEIARWDEDGSVPARASGLLRTVPSFSLPLGVRADSPTLRSDHHEPNYLVLGGCSGPGRDHAWPCCQSLGGRTPGADGRPDHALSQG